jgi:hypothetical protein
MLERHIVAIRVGACTASSDVSHCELLDSIDQRLPTNTAAIV